MTPLFFDLIIVGLLLLSAGLGFMRGFCNEVFTIFGWIGAVIATIYFTPVAREYGRHLIQKTWLADIATASAIFIVTLGVFSLVSYFATRTLAASKLNIVDRGLGFGFGVLRGIVLLGLTFYLFSFVFSDPEQRPAFVREARTLPFLEASANWVKVFLPQQFDDKTMVAAGDTLKSITTDKDKETEDATLQAAKGEGPVVEPPEHFKKENAMAADKADGKVEFQSPVGAAKDQLKNIPTETPQGVNTETAAGEEKKK